MTELPGVIVLGVYRPNPDLLRRQLDSIRAQTLRNWSCIIGLDGSDPDTSALLREIVGSDSRFEILEFAHNVGIYRNFERLLSMVGDDAPWIALSDQDDFWHARKLETLLRSLGTERVFGASCQARVVTDAGRELGCTARHHKPLVSLLLLNEVTGCLSIFKSEVLSLALPFPPASCSARHDQWLGVCAMFMGEFVFTNDVLQDYVQHASNAIGEQEIWSTSRALGMLLTSRTRWSTLTSHPWDWRVVMAKTLQGRVADPSMDDLRLIGRGRFSMPLLRLMLNQARSGAIPVRVAAAFTFGSFHLSLKRRQPCLQHDSFLRNHERTSR